MMKGLISSVVAGVVLASVPALAQEATRVSCEAAVSAVGVSTHVEGGRDFERYKGQVPPGLARARAIENWSLQVSHACPNHSARWWRARGARVECEGSMGHEYCTATAQPSRKLLSYLLAY